MSVSITAVTALSENNFTVYSSGPPISGDFTLVDTEAKINDVINQVNLFAERHIAALSGTPEAMTVSMTRDESVAVKLLISITLIENKKMSLSNSSSTSGSNSTGRSYNYGPIGSSESGSVGTAVSAASALNSSNDAPMVDRFWQAIEKLKTKEREWSRCII